MIKFKQLFKVVTFGDNQTVPNLMSGLYFRYCKLINLKRMWEMALFMCLSFLCFYRSCCVFSTGGWIADLNDLKQVIITRCLLCKGFILGLLALKRFNINSRLDLKAGVS